MDFPFLRVHVLLLVLCFLCAEIAAAHQDEGIFLTWLVSNGATGVLPEDGKLSIFSPSRGSEGSEGNEPYWPGGRGIKASTDIENGTLLVSIPFKLGIDWAEADPRPAPDAGWHFTVVAKLLREVAKGKASFWWPYIQMLPLPEEVKVPWMALSPDQYEEIQHGPSIRRLEAISKHLQSVYANSDVSVLGGASYNLFLWGAHIFLSRHVSIAMPNEMPPKQIILPYLDLFNHRQISANSSGNLAWLEGLYSDHLELRSLGILKRGQQLFDVYGEFPSEDYFLVQGFVPQENPFESITIFESLFEAVAWFIKYGEVKGDWDMTDPWLLTKMMKLATEASAAAMVEVDPDWNELERDGTEWYEGVYSMIKSRRSITVGWNWAGNIRVIAAFTVIWQSLHPEGDISLQRGRRKGQMYAHLALQERCSQLLQGFATTLEEDETLLGKDCGSQPSETCMWDEAVGIGVLEAIRYRVSLKRLLVHLRGHSGNFGNGSGSDENIVAA